MKAAVVALAIASVILTGLVFWQGARIKTLESTLGDGAATETRVTREVVSDDDLAGRVDRLERRVLQLQKVTVARASMGGNGEVDLEAEQAYEDEIEQIQEDVNALIAGEALDTESGRKRLRQAVREEQDAMMAERRQQWVQSMRQEQDELLAKFADDANLSEHQYEELTGAIQQAREQADALMAQMQDGETSWRDLRSQWRDLRDTTDQQIQSILDDDQYAAYVDLQEQQRGGRRGGPM